MCAAVSGAVKPKNPAMICIVSAVGASTTSAVPAPGELLGGPSFAPERIPPKVIGIAWAAGAGSIRAVNAINLKAAKALGVEVGQPPVRAAPTRRSKSLSGKWSVMGRRG
jgi:hypothetical protein